VGRLPGQREHRLLLEAVDLRGEAVERVAAVGRDDPLDAALGEPALGGVEHLGDRRLGAGGGGEVADEADVLAARALPAPVDQRRAARDVASVRRHEQRLLDLLREGRASAQPLVELAPELGDEQGPAAHELSLEGDEAPALTLVAGGELRDLRARDHW